MSTLCARCQSLCVRRLRLRPRLQGDVMSKIVFQTALATLAVSCAMSALAAVAATAQEAGPRRAKATRMQENTQENTQENAQQARVIVKYRPGVGLMQPLSATHKNPQPLHAAALAQRLGLPLQDGRVLGERTQALRGQGLSSGQLLARLRDQADVEWAVLDERRTISAVPNDPYYGGNQVSITPTAGQWYLRAPDSTVVSSINAPGAWAMTLGSAQVTVAVLDTGVRFDHPDLAGKLYAGYDFVSDTTAANDGSGRDSDASDPGDWAAAKECGSNGSKEDSSWHGTQTAGIVGAATDNGTGMASVGRNVMVLPVRVLGKCGGSDSDIIAAMRWAAGLSNNPVANPHPAQVISMSLGKSGACPASYRDVFSELAAAGVTVVVAAGNGAGTAVEAPANCAGALAVAGLRHVGTKSGFSSLGPEVAIAAPGGNCVNLTGACVYAILTTSNAGTTTPSSNTYSDSYIYSVGTSFSTPMVAGVVGLMLSVNNKLTPSQIRSTLQSSARPFPARDSGSTVPACTAPTAAEQVECHCTTSTCGAGMLDAARAVAAIAPAGTVPPAVFISASTTAAAVGKTVALSAKSSSGDSSNIASYAWQVSSGASLAALSGAINTANASLTTSGAGNVTVSLTVTDKNGLSSSSSLGLDVLAPVTEAPPAAEAGKSGGGASSAAWVLMVLLAAALLWAQQRRVIHALRLRAWTRKP
jgi:serine protease